jgi:hypothetical protein
MYPSPNLPLRVENMKTNKYKIRVVRGAFVDPSQLDKLGSTTIEKLERDDWQSIDEVMVNYEQINELQKNMTKHYDNINVPWYMDGYNSENKDNIIVAFGADDGEGGKVFEFKRNDQMAISEVVNYGIKKGIPKEQLDFLEEID